MTKYPLFECEDCIGMREHGCYCAAIGAIAPGGPLPDARIVPCESCGSEGRVLVGHQNDPDPRDDGPCPACEGTGGEVIAVQPVTQEDITSAANETPQYDTLEEKRYDEGFFE